MSNFKRYYQDKNIVFITIVTYNRQQILVKNIELLRQSFRNVKYNYKIIAGIVLPDHLLVIVGFHPTYLLLVQINSQFEKNEQKI